MKRRQPEFQFHCVVADFLRRQYPSLLWFHPANGEARTPQAGARLKRMGVRPGVPDILFFWEHENELYAGALELKAGGGKLSAPQTEYMRTWTAMGAHYACCKTLDEVQWHLNHWHVPKGAA